MARGEGGGRPKVQLTAEHIQTIERLASYGLTQAQIAEWLPISERSLRDRLNDPADAEVSAAYTRGRAKDAELLSSRHRDIAMGRLKKTPIAEQRRALEFRLERQHKMAALHEHQGKGGGPLEVVVTRRVIEADGEG